MTPQMLPEGRAAAFVLAMLFLSPCTGPGAHAQPKSRMRTVAYANVTLEFDGGLAKEFLAETAPAVPLEDPSDKPEGVAPSHVVITLRDSYASRLHRESGSPYALPQVMVFPTTDASDPKFDGKYPMMRGAVKELNVILSRRAGSVSESIPFLPWADERQLFIARKKLLRFRNGRGVLFLTQYDQEESPVTNESLVCTFQGMTDDNAWYVSAVFPVSAGAALPLLQEADKDPGFHSGYDTYIRKTSEKLNRLPAKKFTPGLALLEEMIRSIKVGPR